MRLLLDTHAFIWATDNSSKLGDKARGALESADAVHVSIAAVWEMAIKEGTGRYIFPVERFEETLSAMEFELLPITPSHAIQVTRLPLHHRDPFDRMMVAQARVEGLTLVTADRTLARYDVPLLSATD